MRSKANGVPMGRDRLVGGWSFGRYALLLLVVGFWLSCPGVAAAGGATFTVTNTAEAGPGSLTDAIDAANANPGLDTIAFSIGSGNDQTIVMSDRLLPTITDPVVIDGTTEPGFAGVPLIRLQGHGTGTSTVGLDVVAGSSTISGLDIYGFAFAIVLEQGGGNTVAGNYIGLLPNGTPKDSRDGVAVSSSGNTIGGTTAADRNVIANCLPPVEIAGTSASMNVVEGNYVGTNRQGTAAVGETGAIELFHGAHDNTIGGTSFGAGNVIAGIYAEGGVELFNPGTSGNVVAGNFIGTDRSGLVALPNLYNGVVIDDSASSNTIGGTTPAARNVISGNPLNGVLISRYSAESNVVEGNFIGTDKRGTGALGNGGAGVEIYGVSGNTVGEDDPGAGNRIEFNTGPGILLDGSNTYTVGNALLHNSIFDNGGLGIEITHSENHGQPAPAISPVATSPSTTTITGTLAGSAPATRFRIELFSSPSCDPSGKGEGETYRRATVLTTDASGAGTFTATTWDPVPSGQVITATATNLATNDTSRFSACRRVP